MKVKMSVVGAIRGRPPRSFDEAPEAQLAAMGLFDLLPVASMVGQGLPVGDLLGKPVEMAQIFCPVRTPTVKAAL